MPVNARYSSEQVADILYKTVLRLILKFINYEFL